MFQSVPLALLCLFFATASLLFHTASASGEPEITYCPEFFTIDALLSHTEGKGLGYSQGYSTLDISLFEHFWNEDVVSFLDFRGHLFNKGTHAYNVGLAFRWLDPCYKNIIWGVNTYYDFYQQRHQHDNQWTAGLEALTKNWEFRFNSYFPFGDTSHRERTRHDALNGVDCAVGYRFCRDWGTIYGGLGPYYYWGRKTKKRDRLHHKEAHALGGNISAHTLLFDYFTIDGIASYDSLFHWSGQITVGLHIPFDRIFKDLTLFDNCNPCGLAEKMYLPVLRNEIIVTKKNSRRMRKCSDSKFHP